MDKVVIVLKEFKQCDLEKLIVRRGGKRIKLPCETRWCSFRNALMSLLDNISYMRIIAAENTYRKVEQDVAKLLFDDDFLEAVKQNLKLFDLVCEIINTCQKGDCTLADAVHLWLELDIPTDNQEIKNKLNSRRNQALNKYGLTCYYLHPSYNNDKLSKDQNDIINNFLFRNLDADGIEEWDSFRNNSGLFMQLKEKGVIKPLVFWNMAEMKYPQLAKIALKLLKMPPSTAQIERLFSSWSYVHSSIRNIVAWSLNVPKN